MGCAARDATPAGTRVLAQALPYGYDRMVAVRPAYYLLALPALVPLMAAVTLATVPFRRQNLTPLT